MLSIAVPDTHQACRYSARGAGTDENAPLGDRRSAIFRGCAMRPGVFRLSASRCSTSVGHLSAAAPDSGVRCTSVASTATNMPSVGTARAGSGRSRPAPGQRRLCSHTSPHNWRSTSRKDLSACNRNHRRRCHRETAWRLSPNRLRSRRQARYSSRSSILLHTSRSRLPTRKAEMPRRGASINDASLCDGARGDMPGYFSDEELLALVFLLCVR